MIPPAVRAAWGAGDERLAITLLGRAQGDWPQDSPEWALLERLLGLLLITVQREVEGTFLLERADALLEGYGLEAPGLDWLEGGEG